MWEQANFWPLDELWVAQSCLPVFLLVEHHQLFVFLLKLPMHLQKKILDSQMPKECLPSALGAGWPAHWRCSLTHFQPGAAFRMELSLSSWYSFKFAVLFNLLPVVIKGVRTPSRTHGKDGRFKKEIENTVASNLCFSLELGNTTSV